MSVETTAGGEQPAAGAGNPGGGQSGTGASQGAPGNENADGARADAAATSIPGGGSATGNQTSGEASPANGGLARVLRPIPEAGAQGATGNENADGARADAAATSIPGQTAGPPKGTVGPGQSNDNLPKWTKQLPERLKSDPKSAAALAAF
jgi:hypothetical protein